MQGADGMKSSQPLFDYVTEFPLSCLHHSRGNYFAVGQITMDSHHSIALPKYNQSHSLD